MHTVTVSPKFQVVIPKSIREALHLLPGEKLQVFIYQQRLEFMLLRDVKKMRGFLKGIDTHIERDKDRL
ncbi:MAG: AbrB family transcriptional regulator [Gammaproteobacteria bacterium RIFCSPHIGHO2_12_FULL_38_11]|nr:MAG: AbrB family transcriptional regulator [Gammaproteobacteria bacterium RIFCSPHIGHO2_12_FULL_38_11]